MKLHDAIMRLEGCHNIPMLFSVAAELADIYQGNDIVLEFLKELACQILEDFEEEFMTEEELERGRKQLFARQVFCNGPMPEA